MAVLLPNVQLTIRRRPHPAVRDAHGTPIAGPLSPPEGPYAAGVKDRPDTGSWSLRLPVEMWPCEAGDEVSDGVRTWVLIAEPQLHQVPGVSAVDYVQARATLNPPEVP